MSESTYPELEDLTTLDAATLAHQRRRDEVRHRVRATMPPLPELRFEMAYLRSVLPACRPAKGDSAPTAALAIAEGREVDVLWRSAAWITLRDQVIMPLFQGMFWGVLSVCGGGALASLKTGLGLGQRQAKVPGDVRQRDGGQWRDFAKTGVGAVETSAII